VVQVVIGEEVEFGKFRYNLVGRGCNIFYFGIWKRPLERKQASKINVKPTQPGVIRPRRSINSLRLLKS